jgi:hypothetical protein
LWISILSLVTATPSSAQEWSPSRPDSHAPIGVMGDHGHEAGEWMLSFRYMGMAMDDLRTGTNAVRPDEVLQEFPVTPTKMSMQMYMAGLMFAPYDSVTLMGMLPVTALSMDHLTRTGARFTTTSAGVGDLSLTALIRLIEPRRQRWHLNVGISLPTGSIDKRDDLPAGPDLRLPYPMQLGSGTIDFNPGLTYLGQRGDWSWGAQGGAVLRVGENDNGYRQGDRLHVTGWGSRRLSDALSLSFRADHQTWGNIHGADPMLDAALVPTADPDRHGGKRVDLYGGVNVYLRRGPLSGHRIAAEIGVPVYQRLDGPQLETDWQLVIGWQKAFAIAR